MLSPSFQTQDENEKARLQAAYDSLVVSIQPTTYDMLVIVIYFLCIVSLFGNIICNQNLCAILYSIYM